MSNYVVTSGGFIAVPDDALMHYGVKGMKWGKRKAAVYSTRAKVARSSADEWKEIRDYQVNKLRSKGKLAKASKREAQYNKRINKDLADAKRYEDKAAAKNRGAEYQKKQADVGKSRTMGAKLATNILAGPYANRTYNSVVAAGGTKTAARVVTALTATGGPLAHIAVASLYRRTAEAGGLRGTAKNLASIGNNATKLAEQETRKAIKNTRNAVRNMSRNINDELKKKLD